MITVALRRERVKRCWSQDKVVVPSHPHCVTVDIVMHDVDYVSELVGYPAAASSCRFTISPIHSGAYGRTQPFCSGQSL